MALLKNRHNPDVKDTYGQTPLGLAAGQGHEAVVKLLLEKGAELESKDSEGWTPLSWAAEKGHEAVVKLLLENGAELEAKDSVGGRTRRWSARQESYHELGRAVEHLMLALVEKRDKTSSSCTRGGSRFR